MDREVEPEAQALEDREPPPPVSTVVPADRKGILRTERAGVVPELGLHRLRPTTSNNIYSIS